jgi:hypothetical protein
MTVRDFAHSLSGFWSFPNGRERRLEKGKRNAKEF